MKLVFYSGGYPSENAHLNNSLISLFNKPNLKLTFIPSCSYHGAEDFKEIIAKYRPYGVKKFLKVDVDMDVKLSQRQAILSSDIIFLGGGNTYYFLKHLRKSGVLKDLKEWALSGGVLAGMSAGAIMMTSKIDTAGFPSFDCDENEESMKSLKAMNLVNFEFSPHYKNSKRYDQELMIYSKALESPLYACPDGAGIMLIEDEIRFIGKTFCFFNGKKYIVNKGP